MVQQNNLTATDAAAASDSVQLWKGSRWYSAPLSVLLTYFDAQINPGTVTTQYSAPSASPATVTLTARTTDIWLVLTPTGTIAALTITLPTPGNSYDKQEISVNCTQAITALTVDGNGATAVTGEPASMSANDFFKLRYDAATSTWYRVG